MEHQDRPLFRRQTAEPALELVAVGDGTRRIRGGGFVRWDEANACPPAPIARRLRVACAHHEAVEPCLEPLRVAKCWQVAPRAEKGLLRRILGEMHVSQDPVGEGIATVDGGGRQRGERVLVATLCPFDESGLHVRSWLGRQSGCLTSMEPAGHQTFNRRPPGPRSSS